MARQDKNLQNQLSSIVFYSDYKKYLGYLSGDEIKNLMNLIFDSIENYDFKNPQNPVGYDEATPMTRMVFDVIMGQFRRDKAKYEQRATASRENGKRGGRPKKNLENQTEPSDNPAKPRKPVNDKCKRINDNVEEKEDIPPQEIITSNPSGRTRRTEDYPTLAEVESFVAFRNSPVDAEKFYETYANATPPWTDKNGDSIHDWRKVLIAWEKQYRTVYADDIDEDDKELPLGSVSRVL